MKKVDVLVVGAGLAGLAAALAAAEAGAATAVLSKGRPNATEIVGFNVPGLAPGDSPAEYLADTLRAGGSVNDLRLARRMAEDIGGLFADLERRGLGLCREDGAYHLRLAADNRYPRIVHRGDRTGPVLLALLRRELRRAGVPVYSRTSAPSLIREAGGVRGVWAWEARREAVVGFRAGAVILAAGGAGHVYAYNTNAPGISGQGYHLALEAGAELVDMEFVQFEPFILVHPPAGRGYAVPTTVITHDGGRVLNAVGEEFLPRNESGDLRGVTKWAMARAMFLEVRAGRGRPHGGVDLDLRHLPPEVLAGYPRLLRALERAGIDPARDILEVAPAAHHFMGGVRIDERCWTGVPGLFAAGENAGGVHGANRMAGNSGPEGLVFGRIAGIEAARAAGSRSAVRAGGLQLAAALGTPFSRRMHAAARRRIGQLMSAEAGLARERAGLERARRELTGLWRSIACTPMSLERAEGSGLVISALAVVTGALLREESRGAHFRLDHPTPDDQQYLGSFAVRLERPGEPAGAGEDPPSGDPETLTHRWVPRAEPVAGTPPADAR